LLTRWWALLCHHYTSLCPAAQLTCFSCSCSPLYLAQLLAGCCSAVRLLLAQLLAVRPRAAARCSRLAALAQLLATASLHSAAAQLLSDHFAIFLAHFLHYMPIWNSCLTHFQQGGGGRHASPISCRSESSNISLVVLE
jgi:hypothetical protein